MFILVLFPIWIMIRSCVLCLHLCLWNSSGTAVEPLFAVECPRNRLVCNNILWSINEEAADPSSHFNGYSHFTCFVLCDAMVPFLKGFCKFRAYYITFLRVLAGPLYFHRDEWEAERVMIFPPGGLSSWVVWIVWFSKVGHSPFCDSHRNFYGEMFFFFIFR